MKALTLTQPWATLVAIGAKKIETRSWKTDYRGPLAIHAAQGFGKGGKFEFLATCAEDPFKAVLYPYFQSLGGKDELFPFELANVIPRGAIIATCELVHVKRLIRTSFSSLPDEQYSWNGQRWDLSDQERAFGDYTPGRYAWLLGNIQKLENPIPAKGALSLWEWDEKGWNK